VVPGTLAFGNGASHPTVEGPARRSERFRDWGRRLRERPSAKSVSWGARARGHLIFPELSVPAHVRDILRLYHRRSVRGERTGAGRLTGSRFIPERIEFPPHGSAIGGWPGWLQVSDAAESWIRPYTTK